MILVLVEPGSDVLDGTSLEALTFARAYAEAVSDSSIRAVAVGDLSAAPDEVCAKAGEYGVESVIHVSGDGYDAFAGAAWGAALVAAQRETGASTVITSGTPRGMEIAAHVAARVGVLMAANVTALSSADPVIVTRQVAGGSALEEMRLADSPVVLSVAGHAWQPERIESAADATLSELTVPAEAKDLRAAVISKKAKAAGDTGSLQSARVVVGAGRGVGGAENFGPVTELAKLLGGAVGVSRVVTSMGWRPHDEQVGQTGSRISPDLYIACGISGAIQHWAGCSSAKTILAINTDDQAPMVTKAGYAVIGDMHAIVPAIVDELRARTAG